MAPFKIVGLASTHPRKAFSSGNEALDRYIAEFATQDIRRRISNCFVAIDGTGAMAGYYTLAATSVAISDLEAEDAKRLPRYPLLPAALIGRLAVDTRFQGQRFGSAMVIDAVRRSVAADPAIYAILVDAKDNGAARFYEHLGFHRRVGRRMSLYLPIATALRALGI